MRPRDMFDKHRRSSLELPEQVPVFGLHRLMDPFAPLSLAGANRRRKLVLTPVGVEKVRDRNVLLAAIIDAIEFFLSPQ
jgi:hypothetical protein